MSTEYIKTNWQDGDIITAGKMNNIENGIKGLEQVGTELRNDVDDLADFITVAVGSPLVANTVAEMTDTKKIYVYTGSETGYTNGNWYYYDGTNWQSGGAYNSTAVTTDKTLTNQDVPADAKAVGDEITQLKADLTSMDGKIAAAQITNTASGAIASFPDGADGVPVKDMTVQIEPVQSGSGDPAPDNVRPITGWTGANVVRTGKNLYCGTKATDFSIIYGGKNNAATVVDEDYTFKPGTYRVSLEYMSEPTSKPAMFFSTKVGGVWTNPINRGQVTTFTFTVPENCEHLEIWGYGGNHGGFKNIQIELGSATATAYEPSNGETVNITFPTEAGTVYGGTLDVTSGVLTVDKASVDLGTLTWTLGVTNFKTFSATYSGIKYVYRDTQIICSKYRATNGNDASSSEDNYVWISAANTIAIKDTSKQEYTPAQFKESLDGVMLVYPLTTPQTYQLTPTEVSTLLGLNNIWADTGDVSVDYRADTKLYIEKLTAPTEDDMTANQNIPNGTYFQLGNELYLSTTTIPAGDTINPGTNCTRMSLASALNALNA